MESKHMRNCDGFETHDECSSDTTTEENNSNLNWKNVRDINSIVFSQLSLYLGEKISEKREIVALRDIYNHYISLFTEEKCQSHRESTETSMQAHHLSEKILKSDTKIAKTLYKNRVFLHPQDMGLDEMLSKGFELEDDISTKIRKIGMEIRKSINQMNTKKMPQTNITLKNIIEGECEIPKELHLLIESIVESPRVQNNENSSYRAIRKNKILSICSSIILTASSGLIRPSMCLQLALAAKSLTGSRRMINILNRLGHCVSYTVTEGIETELAYTCSLENVILPFDLSPHSYTHVAFDNYDQYVETSSGKDTLHDTVGIAYQNCVEFGELSMNSLQQSINDIDNSRSRRRKYISTFDDTIQPYLKGNNPIACLSGIEPTVPENWESVSDSNTLWMMYHALKSGYAKKWFAWYSERIVDSNPLQKIGYLPIINASPTSDAVVLKTMDMALKLADECNQDYIVVTYDLAIASKAYKILADSNNKFDRLFINLGAFHIELSFFKVSNLYL